MKLGSSTSHSQALSNNPYPEPIIYSFQLPSTFGSKLQPAQTLLLIHSFAYKFSNRQRAAAHFIGDHPINVKSSDKNFTEGEYSKATGFWG